MIEKKVIIQKHHNKNWDSVNKLVKDERLQTTTII